MGADKSLARPERKKTNVSVRIAFPLAPCLAGKKMMTACVSMLLKFRASLTCSRACFHPGRAKDISAPGSYEFYLPILIATSHVPPYPKYIL